MPRSKTPCIMSSCDICGIKVLNPYIFKRHLHKCYTIHGIASKRSTPRNPIRLKGTEDIRSPDHQSSGFPDKANEESSQSEFVKTNRNGKEEMLKNDLQEQLSDLPSAVVSSSSAFQWGVSSSPQVASDLTSVDKESSLLSSDVDASPQTILSRSKFER